MARYRIHRIKDTPKETFRWSAHTGGLAIVKLKDYEVGTEVEAATAYAAWHVLQAAGPAQALRPGDLLELVTNDGAPGALQIVKYTGFDAAKWFVPEPKAEGPLFSLQGPVDASTYSELQSA